MAGSDTHYASGDEIRIRARVAHEEWCGVVVFDLGTGSFAPGYSTADWSYLGRGFMVEFDKAGLVFHDVADEELVLVGRV